MYNKDSQDKMLNNTIFMCKDVKYTINVKPQRQPQSIQRHFVSSRHDEIQIKLIVSMFYRAGVRLKRTTYKHITFIYTFFNGQYIQNTIHGNTDIRIYITQYLNNLFPYLFIYFYSTTLWLIFYQWATLVKQFLPICFKYGIPKK